MFFKFQVNMNNFILVFSVVISTVIYTSLWNKKNPLRCTDVGTLTLIMKALKST